LFNYFVVLSGGFFILSWPEVPNSYTYQSVAQNTGDLTVIEGFNGTQLSGKSNEDVEVWYETGYTLQYIPSNLPVFSQILKECKLSHHFYILLQIT
jgi:hypothetical protein